MSANCGLQVQTVGSNSIFSTITSAGGGLGGGGGTNSGRVQFGGNGGKVVAVVQTIKQMVQEICTGSREAQMADTVQEQVLHISSRWRRRRCRSKGGT